MNFVCRFCPTIVAMLSVFAACADTEAPARCRELRDAYCDKQGALCEGATEAGCTGLFDELIACEDAVGIDDDYRDCRAEIDALTECPVALPAQCRGAIYLPDEDD
ncbi:MAG: hypothetical protein ACO3JL_14155 [Myxococcota bacterium]